MRYVTFSSHLMCLTSLNSFHALQTAAGESVYLTRLKTYRVGLRLFLFIKDAILKFICQNISNKLTKRTLLAVRNAIVSCTQCLFVGCLTSQQHASVSQGWICSDNSTCCHTKIEVADPTFYLTQSQHTDTGPTSPRADPITPGAWQGSHWSANF